MDSIASPHDTFFRENELEASAAARA